MAERRVIPNSNTNLVALLDRRGDPQHEAWIAIPIVGWELVENDGVTGTYPVLMAGWSPGIGMLPIYNRATGVVSLCEHAWRSLEEFEDDMSRSNAFEPVPEVAR